MTNEEQIEKLVERLINRVEKANTIFLKNIGEAVKKIGKLTSSQAHQLMQILKYGTKYDDIVEQITKYTDLNVKDIEKIFNEYAKQDQQFYKQFYKYRNKPFIPFDKNIALKQQTMALANIVRNEMYNFTRQNILGYTINGKFFNMRETYNKLLDEAFLQVGQGKITYDTALRNILKEIGGSGLKTLDYESGRSIRLDSAIRMQLKSRLRELHNENQKIIGDEIGADGIEISVHTNPAEDHEAVQGRQFSLEEYTKLNDGLMAKDYKGKTYTLDHDGKNGYRPISEMNCYHYIFSIVLGVSKPLYSDDELKQIIENNEKGFELDGKHYTMYEGTQLQRALEREIRKNKDIQILAKESDNKELIESSQDNITLLTRKYNELSSISRLPKRMDRLSVSNYYSTGKRKTANVVAFNRYKNKNIGYIEKLNLKNKELINNKITEYRKSILPEQVENAVVIDKYGEVFKIKGDKNKIDIPKWLDKENSIIMHNHVEDRSNYSFSDEDIKLFLDNNVSKLYGDDLEFQYIVEKNKATIHDVKNLKTDWTDINYKAIELSMNNKLDIDKDGYHYIVNELAKKYKFKYMRNKQKLFDKE